MQYSNWQTALRQAERDPQSLLEKCHLTQQEMPLAGPSREKFPLRAPPSYTARIRHGDPADPLLRQILPVSEEDASVAGFETDPLAERDYQPAPGVLHKYHGRVLLIVTGACAIHCRYCFRRHFPYEETGLRDSQRDAALEYIRHRSEIEEVIFSGGDPLILANDRLADLIVRLAGIPHLRRLRIHTRIPVVLPERIDNGFLELLGMTRLQPVLVVHSNHPDELDESVRTVITRIRMQQIPVFNQAVLLRGINDSVATLRELSNKLFEYGIIPYYLHMLDPVAGAAHFEVDEEKARDLLHGLQQVLPGYLVPRLVREVPGQSSKTPI